MKASDAAAPVGELGLMVTIATQKLKEVWVPCLWNSFIYEQRIQRASFLN
jgi:hypothetical protein